MAIDADCVVADMNIFTVAECDAVRLAVLRANNMPTETYKAAIRAYEKVKEHTDWSTDPALDVHKEPKP